MLMQIEYFANLILIQNERIKSGALCIEEALRAATENTICSTDKTMLMFFGDVHYYFICWDNINKLFKRVNKLLPQSDKLEKLNTKYKEIFIGHNKFRNHLEHIDDRIQSRIMDLGNFSHGNFTFNNESIDVSENDARHIVGFYNDLMAALNEMLDKQLKEGAP
jgi:hypothetical protein